MKKCGFSHKIGVKNCNNTVLEGVKKCLYKTEKYSIMKRSALNKLIAWKQSKRRKPLIINGARQVGKTWLMQKFGEDYYSKVAYVSFYNNERAKRIFDNDYDMKRIILSLQLETQIKITPNDTLIILDEIQECPKALEALKYFCEDASEYHVMAAGSLLGVALHSGISYPVGKVNLLDLHPLSYKEFLDAIGEEQLALALDSKDYSIIDTFADKYLFNLKNYLYVGGMPDVVNCFVEEHDYNVVRDLQSDIIRMYRDDFGKHIPDSDFSKVCLVLDSVVVQLAKENKKFFFGNIKKGARSSDFKNAIEWLVNAGLVHKVSKVNEPHVPLAAYKDISAYKLFFLDVGLLGAMSELDPVSIIEGNQIFIEFKGAFAEQYVLQELKAETNYTPYYFSTQSSRFEQDFMIQKENKVVPIEVKAATNIKSPSLKAFYDKFHPEKSIRISALPYIDQGWMCNLPLYAVCNI